MDNLKRSSSDKQKSIAIPIKKDKSKSRSGTNSPSEPSSESHSLSSSLKDAGTKDKTSSKKLLTSSDKKVLTSSDGKSRTRSDGAKKTEETEKKDARKKIEIIGADEKIDKERRKKGTNPETVPKPEEPKKEGTQELHIPSRPFSELPQKTQDAIKIQGIKVEELTPEQMDILWHTAWFLSRKEFPTTFLMYGKEVEPQLCASDAQMEIAKKVLMTPDVPIKKLFPTLEFSAEGGFGQVFVGKMVGEKKKKLRVAIKKLPHSTPKQISSNLSELYFLSTISHPNIVKFLCCYHCPPDPKSKIEQDHTEHIMLVMEWLEGGTLNQAAKSGGKFEDHHIAFVARECFKGIDYLHSLNLVHRDLKSSNVMLSTTGEVKIIDFGLCIDISAGKKTKILGSPMWIPPEMIRSIPHGKPADIWSMGVCILELYLGGPPMKREAIKCMYTAATQGFAHLIPSTASSKARSFLTSCLTVDQDKRPTASQLLEHPWVNDDADLSRGIQTILKQIFLVKNLSSIGF